MKAACTRVHIAMRRMTRRGGPTVSTVDISAVKKSYGAAAVLHGIDLAVADGEFVVLVGPSGCGKSTLLRMIAGLEEITSGTIAFDGRVVNDATPKERNVAMVFQNYALYPHMTVVENIGLNLRIAGQRRVDVQARVLEVARLLDIEALLARRPAQLSGGQRQRVAMGRALVRDPSVFLFDEPLSNLDAKLRVQMRGEIKALQSKVRKTSIYVTHDQAEAMTLADRVVVMNQGRIEQQGAPMDLYARPDNLFVAGFLGSPAMNIAEATVQADEISVVTRSGASLRLSRAFAGQGGRDVIVGVRPEDLTLAPDGPIKGVVTIVEPMGPLTYLGVSHDDATFWASVPASVSLSTGDVVALRAAGAVHAFDPESGRRLA